MSLQNGDGEAGGSDAKASIARRIFHALCHDTLVQLALDTHAEEAQRRRSEEDSSDSDSEREEGEVGSRHSAKRSRTSDPAASRPNGSDASNANGSANNGTASGANGGPSTAASLLTSTYSSNPLIRCVLCNRHVASNRYAPHLAKCMGLGSANGSKSLASGLKRKAAAAAAAAAAANGGTSGSGTPVPASSYSSAAERSGGGKTRGRPPKYGGNKDRHGTLSARSTPGFAGKEGSAAL
ncbi:unnamed protein product [Parajaminaea phylloscopi]